MSSRPGDEHMPVCVWRLGPLELWAVIGCGWRDIPRGGRWKAGIRWSRDLELSGNVANLFHASTASLLAVSLAACSVVSTYGAIESSADSLRREIDRGVLDGLFAKAEDSLRCRDGQSVVDVVLYSDSSGNPRKYDVSAGTGDSLQSTAYYYSSGVLRLIVQESGAVNGSAREVHVYFDAAGKRVAETEPRSSGPGWTFLEPSEIRDPVLDLQGLQSHRGDIAAYCGED